MGQQNTFETTSTGQRKVTGTRPAGPGTFDQSTQPVLGALKKAAMEPVAPVETDEMEMPRLPMQQIQPEYAAIIQALMRAQGRL